MGPFDGLSVCTRFQAPPPGEIAQIQSLGFKWIRNDVSWGAIEYKPGVYDFSQYDQLVSACQAAGIRINFVLTGGNPLYTSGNALPTTAAQLTAFGNFVYALVTHYQHQGMVWEGTNEPDLSCSLSQYLAINQTIVTNLRAASPDEWYVGPSVSSVSRDVAWNFLKGCLDAGCLLNWDAVAIHPYYGGVEPEILGPAIQATQALIQSYAPPGRTVPIMATEWGYNPTWTPLKLTPSPFSPNAPNVLKSVFDFSVSPWTGYWLKPALTPGIPDPLGGTGAVRLASADYPSGPGQYFSGLVQRGTVVVGAYYTVSVYLRSEGAPFVVYLGLEDGNTSGVVIDGVWRRYTFTFQAKNAYNDNRLFQVFERVANNPAWDVYGPQSELALNVTPALIASAKAATIANFLPRMYMTCLWYNVGYLAVYSWHDDPNSPGFGLLDPNNNPTPGYNSMKAFFLANQ